MTFGRPLPVVLTALMATLVLSLGIGAAACAKPLEFTDWTIPVPEGTEIITYPPVDPTQRAGQRIELVEDLTIGARGDDLNYAFGSSVPRTDVDAAGNIYVIDGANSRLQVFDPTGQFVRTMGRAGQGPAEFGRAQYVALAGGELIVLDTANGRFSHWSTAGEHIGDVPIVPRRPYSHMRGNPDGTVILRYVARPEAPGEDSRAVIVRLDEEARELVEFGRALWPPITSYPPPERGQSTRSIGFVMAASQPEFALDPGRAVYYAGVVLQARSVLAPGHRSARPPQGATAGERV